MINPLSKIFAFILFLYLAIIVPVYNQFWMVDKLINNQVNVTTSKFQKVARNHGYVSKEDYEMFTRELANTRRDYTITMVHRKIQYYPLSPTDPKYKPEKPYSVESIAFAQDAILNDIYINHKDYKMNYGDDFDVKVNEKNGFNKGSNIFLNFISGNTNSKSLIYANYGGMVEQ